jgi:hypothetical protein
VITIKLASGSQAGLERHGVVYEIGERQGSPMSDPQQKPEPPKDQSPGRELGASAGSACELGSACPYLKDLLDAREEIQQLKKILALKLDAMPSGLSAGQSKQFESALGRLLENLGQCEHHDHHGNCQTHWCENPCSVAEARKLTTQNTKLSDGATVEKGSNAG